MHGAPRGASAVAYRRIREAIADLTFQPGQHLQEAFLAGWLGVSRTPVRDALRRLDRDGLVESAGTRGVVVAEVTIDDVEQAYLMLEVLEGLTSRIAAQRRTDEGSAALARIVDDMHAATTAGDGKQWAQHDATLHDTIRWIAAVPRLAQITSMVYPIIDRVRNTYLLDGSEPDRLALQSALHCELAEAVIAGDPERAEAKARRTFAVGGAANVRLLRHWISHLRRSF